MKARYLFSAIIFKYNPDNDIYNRIDEVPEQLIEAKINGSWRGKVFFSKKIKEENGAFKFSEESLLLDINDLFLVQKQLPAEGEMGDLESHRIWKDVTANLKEKEYSKATKAKIDVEVEQRHRIAEFQKNNQQLEPKYFVPDPIHGCPKLTELGEKLLNDMLGN